MDKVNSKCRRKRKFPSPNPLFERWLKEWKDDAAEKGLKSRFNYSKALTSLRKYPLPLSSGKEAKILEYFGDKICSMLDEKLCEWKNSQGDSYAGPIAPISCSTSSSSSSPNSQTVRVKPIAFAEKISKRTKSNVNNSSSSSISSYSSQSSTNNQAAFAEKKSSKMTKSTVIVKRDFTAVQKVPDVLFSFQSTSQDFYCDNGFSLYPGNFDIVLCVDNCETLSGHGKTKKQVISELEKSNLQFDVRKLNVGDFLWVAQEKNGSHRELVLNFIVERKRLDDLSQSIKDGRFREQKFRLRNCGLKHPIYLVEYHSSVKHCGLPESTLQQAVINTQIVDNFIVKQTRDIKESTAYLSIMTKYLKNMYEGQILKSGSRETVQRSNCPSNIFMDFTEFNCTSVKNKCLTIKEMFAKHLLQFFGLSVDRASSIVERFQTPSKLLEAYNNCSSDAQRIQLLSNLRFGKSQKPLGQAISKSVHMFYCTEGALT